MTEVLIDFSGLDYIRRAQDKPKRQLEAEQLEVVRRHQELAEQGLAKIATADVVDDPRAILDQIYDYHNVDLPPAA